MPIRQDNRRLPVIPKTREACLFLCLLFLTLVMGPAVDAEDWSRFRGPMAQASPTMWVSRLS